jgi:DNA-binding NarL/FixJ family response regulator
MGPGPADGYGPRVGASPAPLDVLYLLGPASPRGWFARALSNQPTPIEVRDCPSLAVGLEQLRAAPYDVVVLDRDVSDRPPAETMLAIQTSTHELQAVVVLSDDHQRHDAAEFLSGGAAAYLPLRTTTPAELAWQLQAAAERTVLRRENQQLRAWQQRHAEREHEAILELLKEQAAVFQAAARGDTSTHHTALGPPQLADRLREQCRELLQAYIIMGRGHLAGEVRRFTDRLHTEQIPLTEILETLNEAITRQAADRGSRSFRHIFNRGNLLILDVIVQWNARLPNAPLPIGDTYEAVNHRSDLQ